MRKISNVLFVGMYPNEVNKYRNVFFQNLIFAMADAGVKCTVISPVPITKYRNKIKLISKHEVHLTKKKTPVDVYYPRYISASSKQIGKYNTEKLSEKLFENSAIKIAKQLNIKFDFVYGHFVLYGGLAAIKIGNILNIPSFFAYGECDFQSEIGNTYGIPKKEEFYGLSGIISVSSKNTKELKELKFVDGIPIITAPNSTDLMLFNIMDKVKCREQLKIPKDKYIVGFVGGFIDRKGDKRLLQAVEELDDVYVAFAGKGDNPPYGEKVVFCQAMKHEEIPVFLNAIDVFVLPTLAEGSCNAIIEAMSCGVPVISSDLPFNDDALNSDNSIRIDPISIEEIKSAIESLKDEKLRKHMGQKAFETAQKFNIELRAKKILNFVSQNI